MKRAYDLQLRILVSPHHRGFRAEALEIEGFITASTMRAALEGYVCGVRNLLCVGEPIYRKCPAGLVARWDDVPVDGEDVSGENGFMVSIAACYPDTPDHSSRQSAR